MPNMDDRLERFAFGVGRRRVGYMLQFSCINNNEMDEKHVRNFIVYIFLFVIICLLFIPTLI